MRNRLYGFETMRTIAQIFVVFSEMLNFTVALINHLVVKFARNFVVQKAQDPKEKEENVIYIPVILNGLLTDGSNVLILVVLKVKVMGVESFNLCYHSTAPAQRVLLKILTRKP